MQTTTHNTLSIAENETTVFVSIDKRGVSPESLNAALTNLRVLFGNNVPEVSDEEQAEIETELNAMTDEEREITIPVAMYERLIEELEDYEDAEAVRQAKAEGGEPVLWDDIKKTNGWG